MRENDFRSNKTWFQKILISFALFLLRKAGDAPERYEPKQGVIKRRKSYFVELEEAGYLVEQKTPYQFRVNGVLDLYPVNAKYHDLKTGKRGEFVGKNLATFVRRYFGEI